jgi:lipopolysaccharide biosynthesis regulator YciM
LREKLSNYTLNVTTRITEKEDTEAIYTAQDRFSKMVSKNPSLDLLKKAMDLEIN